MVGNCIFKIIVGLFYWDLTLLTVSFWAKRSFHRTKMSVRMYMGHIYLRKREGNRHCGKQEGGKNSGCFYSW